MLIIHKQIYINKSPPRKFFLKQKRGLPHKRGISSAGGSRGIPLETVSEFRQKKP